jgi:hypothetical protein
MKKVLKALLLIVVVFLVVIQFFRPEKNQAAGVATNDITLHYGVAPEVQKVLTKSCYDCHSDRTAYPWYNNIQPFAWYLANHVKEGKRELNFSEFSSYKPKKAAHKLDELIAEVGEHEMPLSSYTLIHRDAALTDQEVKLISDWATHLSDSIRAAYHLPQQ